MLLYSNLWKLLFVCVTIKPGFHSNARKALRKKKYASKIKSAQETQQTQENYAVKKTKIRKRKSRILVYTKLEWMGYRVVKKAWQYIQPFW